MNTKICTKCQQEKPINNFYKQNDRKNGASYCKDCFNKYCINRWIERKKEAIKLKGSKCEICQLEDHYSVYAFHHTNPKTKEANWNKMRLWSWERVLKELEQCQLVCHNCHAKIHWESS